MTSEPHRTIRIAAALIDDDQGRLLLVRKAGTQWFMQPGGKIEGEEKPRSALLRELREEIGLELEEEAPRYLGCFSAPAANEPASTVEAELFHVRTSQAPAASSEIEEALWADPTAAKLMPLAPLTRDHVMPIAASFRP